ncbi:MAG: ribulokinase, partial [Terriglobales bacterium]
QLHRGGDDPERATQSHEDHMRALAQAMRHAVQVAGVLPQPVAALALDTTGSSVIMVDGRMRPLSEYYLWCDHRAKEEAEEITAMARVRELAALSWCGGVYSAEWGWAKLLHWLRHHSPMQRSNLASAFEHCDYVAATLAGVVDPAQAARSVCAMGHKWMWHPDCGGLPEEGFWQAVDPLLTGMRAKLGGTPLTSDHIAGRLAGPWAEALNLPVGIPIPVGAFDAHWDTIGAGARAGDMVNVIGTSTCMIGITPSANRIPGVCGIVRGSVHPSFTGVEAGLSATGDIFEAIARRAGASIATLSHGLARYRAGQTGLLRLCWDNGDRTVLVNPNLGGVTLGWKLHHSAQDELFAAIEGTALHTRLVLDRMAEYGARFDRVIHSGGIPQSNPVLNQVYADVLGRPVLVPSRPIAGLGAACFALLAAGAVASLEDAQKLVCPPHAIFHPHPEAQPVYARLYEHYRRLYFALGAPAAGASASPQGSPELAACLPELIKLAAASRKATAN